MLQIRIKYLDKAELEEAATAIEKQFEIINFTKEAKSNNPKYVNSKWKIAYMEVERKDDK